MGGLAKKLIASSGGEEKLYVDDVFSTYLYTGNGASQTITNGINFAGIPGYLIWTKARSAATDHVLTASPNANYVGTGLSSNTTGPQNVSNGITGLLVNGYSLGNNANTNANGTTYTSWTFRKAPKFFDVVTWTGPEGSRNISHSLGVAPGLVLIKNVTQSLSWLVYHISNGANYNLVLNTTAAKAFNSGIFPRYTSSSIGIDYGDQNAVGQTYVAYLFAHDPSADGIIQCGSFTTDGSGNATVNLGWEPQFVLVKCSSGSDNWRIFDSARGMTADGGGEPILYPNLSEEENVDVGFNEIRPTATGFVAKYSEANSTLIYLAIRRPNKPPTSGTQVYKAAVNAAGSGSATVSIGFPTDTAFAITRDGTNPQLVVDRMRGNNAYLYSNTTGAEQTFTNTARFDYQNSFAVSFGSAANVLQCFRRAPGFFDVVCYTGTGVDTQRFKHNLRARPELILVKSRSTAGNWLVTIRLGYSYWRAGSSATGLCLNGVSGSTVSKNYDDVNTETEFAPFTAGDGWEDVWSTGKQCVAYLFASLPGISKVGSYTGNGSSQTINCGFTSGARFILIKRTDSTGDWYVWDSVRGIVAANDPHLSLNTTAAEVTTDDSVDPESTGFIVNQNTATNINVNGGSYIFLAIA